MTPLRVHLVKEYRRQSFGDGWPAVAIFETACGILGYPEYSDGGRRVGGVGCGVRAVPSRVFGEDRRICSRCSRHFERGLFTEDNR